MFNALMKHWITWNICSNLIITRHNHKLLSFNTEFFYKVLYPRELTSSMILYFRTKSNHNILHFTFPCTKLPPTKVQYSLVDRLLDKKSA